MHQNATNFPVPKGSSGLVASLKQIQARLGTANEQPGDLEMARQLGHTVRNRATVAVLTAELEKLRAS